MSRRTVNTEGATIQVAENGTGDPALVFLHYWGGSSRTWKKVIDQLDGKPCSIALDQRGWGDSVATDGRYDLTAMADDVEAVAHTLGPSEYVLVGHSMGGVSAAESDAPGQ
jgi:pimeloyl-ACP methyl ester carboxylesterase